MIKYFPHIKVYCTEESYYLIDIMLKDSIKLLESDLAEYFNNELLEYFSKEILEKINYLLNPVKYYNSIDLGDSIKCEFRPAGHILGAASIYFEYGEQNILFSGDINFDKQFVLKGADLPKHHIDTLVFEATSAASEKTEYSYSKKELAKHINQISDESGSILVPIFSLGKTQEILRALFELKYRGQIPNLPIYYGGMSRKISLYYDKFCYNPQMLYPGSEISDIETIELRKDDIHSGKFYKEPSIILASSGMLNNNTFAYKLAENWFKRKNFGIAIVGYQDEDSNGYALLNSEIDKKFKFGGYETIRKCRIKNFRFSSHADFQSIINYIDLVKPNRVFFNHCSEESAFAAVEKLYDNSYKGRVIFPDNDDKFLF